MSQPAPSIATNVDLKMPDRSQVIGLKEPLLIYNTPAILLEWPFVKVAMVKMMVSGNSAKTQMMLAGMAFIKLRVHR
jgi:hypothetical protein